MSADESRSRPLPYWPEGTVAVLSTAGQDVGAVPVASLLRDGDRSVLFTLPRASDALARLRRSPAVALSVLGDRGTAFTARGDARVVVESMLEQPTFAAVELKVDAIDDHRQIGWAVRVLWTDQRELEALRERISALQWLAGSRLMS
jgi:hypothetical protein